jgi:hypothetical protein
MKKTELIAKNIVKYVELHPKCKRFDAEVDAKVGRESYPWELCKHLFDYERIGKTFYYSRNSEPFSLNVPKKRKQYTGISALTVSNSVNIEMLLERGESYTGSEIRRKLKMTLSAYKTAIIEAKVTRYSIKGNGYLYAAAGSINMPAVNSKTAEIAQDILFLVGEHPKISGEDIRQKLGLNIIVFRCAMKLITDKVRKNHINYKPHYSLRDAPMSAYDDIYQKIEPIITMTPSKYNGKILTQWRTALPWDLSPVNT